MMHTEMEDEVGVPAGTHLAFELPKSVVAAGEVLRAVCAKKEGAVFIAAWTRFRWHISGPPHDGELRRREVRVSFALVSGTDGLEVHANISLFGDGHGHWLHATVELVVAGSSRIEEWEAELIGSQFDARPKP